MMVNVNDKNYLNSNGLDIRQGAIRAIKPDSTSDNYLNWNDGLKIKNGGIESKDIWYGPVKIVSVSNRCLDSDQFGDGQNGAYDCQENSRNQHWFIDPIRGQIRAANGGKCLEDNGSKIFLQNCNQWVMRQTFDLNDGRLKVRSHEGCVDMNPSNTNRRWTCEYNDNMRIRFIDAGTPPN